MKLTEQKRKNILTASVSIFINLIQCLKYMYFCLYFLNLYFYICPVLQSMTNATCMRERERGREGEKERGREGEREREREGEGKEVKASQGTCACTRLRTCVRA